MNIGDVTIERTELHKLLATGDGDAALVYLCLQCGNSPKEAELSLSLSSGRFARAMATLRQVGLWKEESSRILLSQQPPQYTEEDVQSAVTENTEFDMLVGEVQGILGRILTTEELKLLLTFKNYLGLPVEVISLLVNFCKERTRRKGSSRNPSLRAIEKEAYAWAEKGIDTMEEALAYIQGQDAQQTRLNNLMKLLQISGRRLTPAEEHYALNWLEMDFDLEALQMAYEKTCLNTGGLKWAYMDKILSSWHRQGLHTAAEVRAGDRGAPKASAGAARNAVLQTQRVQAGSAGLGEFEKEAIARMLREHEQEKGV